MDTSWFQASAEFFGFASSSPAKPESMSKKHKASDDVECPAKRVRYSEDAYRTSPYGSVSQSVRHGSAATSKGVANTLPRILVSPDRASIIPQGSSPARLADVKQRVATPAQVAHPRFADSPTTTKTSPTKKPRTITLSPITETSAPWSSSTLSNTAKWIEDANKRAFEIAGKSTDPKKAVGLSVKEPEYAIHDIEIRDAMWQITDLMQTFVEDYFGFALTTKLSTAFFKQFSPETAKVIGCVASGGPGGVQGWHDLFIDATKRQALVMAIIGNVLVEQVFQHIFFGGHERHVRDIAQLQKTHKDDDGFTRNEKYAMRARGHMDVDPLSNTPFELPSNFANHVNRIVGVIYTHIKPIWTLNPTAPERQDIVGNLHAIVTYAGILSLQMRIDPHTVYHFQPLFKEDTYTSKSMECFNQDRMVQTNPRTSETDAGLENAEKKRRAALSAPEKKRAQNDDPLTQITILEGINAYRLGGWEAPDSTILGVKHEKSEYANEGVRVRKLTNGLAYCRWGRARCFKDGNSDDVPGHHGTAWHGGFAEFNDVKGVVNWQSIEREMKEEKMKAKLAVAKGKGKGSGRCFSGEDSPC